MRDDVDPAFLAPLSMEQLTTLLTKVDATLEEGRALREKILQTMQARRDDPVWPEALPLPNRR